MQKIVQSLGLVNILSRLWENILLIFFAVAILLIHQKCDIKPGIILNILSPFPSISEIFGCSFYKKNPKTLAKHIVDLHAADTDVTVVKESKLTIDNVESVKELDIATFRRFISFARANCGPRLSDSAAKRLQEKYVNMRNSTAIGSPKSKKNNKCIPITVRQLEALIRIAESLAKMRLAAFTSVEDVDEAIRLFHVSTLTAAESGSLSGVEGVTSNEDFSLLERVESQLRKRFIPGSQISHRTILQDFANQNFPEMVVNRAINSLIQRGEAQFSGNRKTLIRIK